MSARGVWSLERAGRVVGWFASVGPASAGWYPARTGLVEQADAAMVRFVCGRAPLLPPGWRVRSWSEAPAELLQLLDEFSAVVVGGEVGQSVH